jgi:hypothetical protein
VLDASLLRPELRRKTPEAQPFDPPFADPGYAAQSEIASKNI